MVQGLMKVGSEQLSKQKELSVSLRRLTGEVRAVNIVFVHGLMGSANKTWCHDSDSSTHWPDWLVEYGNVWILDYPADLLWWPSSGADMGLTERARNILDILVNHSIEQLPTVYITHSLGGLLVKTILRVAKDMNEPAWSELLSGTRGIVFLGTPHTGSSLATIANLLRALGFKTNVTQLKSNEAHLLDLTSWYSKNASKLGVKSLAYYEKGTIKGFKVVDEASADPRVSDCNAIPSDANHIDICKPRSQNDQVYMGVVRFIKNIFGLVQNKGHVCRLRTTAI